MNEIQWYELRVEGGAGTRAGLATGIKEAIAIGENGRLCAVGTGSTLKFASAAEARDYLDCSTNSGTYKFEIVLCRSVATAGKDAGARRS